MNYTDLNWVHFSATFAFNSLMRGKLSFVFYSDVTLDSKCNKSTCIGLLASLHDEDFIKLCRGLTRVRAVCFYKQPYSGFLNLNHHVSNPRFHLWRTCCWVQAIMRQVTKLLGFRARWRQHRSVFRISLKSLSDNAIIHYGLLLEKTDSRHQILLVFWQQS